MITIDKTYAESYFASRLYSDTWIDADEADKDIALTWASKLIDQRYDFLVDYSIPENVIPNAVKDAIAELAMFVLSKDPNSTPNEMKYTNMKFDDMEVTVNPSYAKTVSIIPDYINDMLLPYTKRKSSGSAYKTSGGRRITRC